MIRLLDGAELQYLASQPGATPELVERFRRQRCRLFREYLRWLQHDFHAACRALTILIMESKADRRDLLRAVLAARAQFAVGLLRVRWRLLLYGWNGGSEPAAQLVRLFEALQLELIAHIPPAAAPQSS